MGDPSRSPANPEGARMRRVDLTGTRELRRVAMYALPAFCITVGMIVYVAWLKS
jgi:hypothetical protein